MSARYSTKECKNELLKQSNDKLFELTIIKEKTPESIWEDDLDALEKKLDEIEENELRKVLGVNAVNSMEMDRFEASSSKPISSTTIAANAKVYPSKKNESSRGSMDDEEDSDGNSSSTSLPKRMGTSRHTATKVENYTELSDSESETGSCDDEQSSSDDEESNIVTESNIDFKKDNKKRKYQSDSDESMSLAPENEMDDDSSIMVCYKIHIEIVFFYIFLT